MKLILCLIVSFFVTQVSGQRVFYFQPDNYARGALDSISVTPAEYDIYVRQICISRIRQNFVTCPPGVIPDSVNRVEVEYLLKSKTTNRVIYITNYPDQFEEVIAEQIFDIDNGTVNLNPWFFSKFFIGTYDDNLGQILFPKSDSETLTISYSSERNRIYWDTLQLPGRTAPTDLNRAFSPRVAFQKYERFKWLFKDAKATSQGIPLLRDYLYISTTEPLKGVFFRLSRQWDDRVCCYIFFGFGRLVTKVF